MENEDTESASKDSEKENEAELDSKDKYGASLTTSAVPGTTLDIRRIEN
jgi:hypothetical protein